MALNLVSLFKGWRIVDLVLKRIITEYDTIPSGISDNNMHLLWQSQTIVSPDKKHFVNGSQGFSLQTFAINDDYSIVSIISEDVFPLLHEGRDYAPHNDALGLLSFTADNNKLYGVYAETKNESDANKIGVWNWDGTPERLIITDAPIISIAVTEDGKTIFGFILVNDDIAIAKIALD